MKSISILIEINMKPTPATATILQTARPANARRRRLPIKTIFSFSNQNHISMNLQVSRRDSVGFNGSQLRDGCGRREVRCGRWRSTRRAKMWIYNQQRAGRWEPSQQTVGSIFTTGGQNSLSSHGPASRYKEPAAATTPGLRMLLAGYISVECHD